MKVKALRIGFHAGVRRAPGEIFPLAEGEKPGKWMAPVPDDVEATRTEPKAKGKKSGPATFSEIAKADSEANKVKGADDLV